VRQIEVSGIADIAKRKRPANERAFYYILLHLLILFR